MTTPLNRLDEAVTRLLYEIKGVTLDEEGRKRAEVLSNLVTALVRAREGVVLSSGLAKIVERLDGATPDDVLVLAEAAAALRGDRGSDQVSG